MNSSASLNDILSELQTSYPDCGALSLSPAERWDDGSIVGNGSQGALAFGRTGAEELVLSQEELFLPLFPFSGYLPVKEQYSEIQRLVIEGQSAEAQDLIRKLKVEGDFQDYNTTDPFVGACSLDIKMAKVDEYTRYIRSVDFTTGEALVAWGEASEIIHRQFFVSRADNVVVIKVSSPSQTRLNLNLRLREIEYDQPPQAKAQNIYEKTIDHCESRVKGHHLYHQMHFNRRWDSQQLWGAATIGRVIANGGEVEEEKGRLHVVDANEVLVILRTIPEKRGSSLSMSDEADRLEGLEPDYDTLLAKHKVIHSELFNRCRLSLSSDEEQRVSTEELQASSRVGATAPALVEKAFAAGRYSIISSTGKLPPLLQGVWTGTWKPRWSGDYTLNGNVQSMMASSLNGNHYECQEAVMDYLDSLMNDFCENAKELLGFRGPLIPWRSSTHGKTHYLAYLKYHHDFPGIYWFAGTGWFARIYYDYYQYTGDESFFKNRYKPFLLNTVALYEDYLRVEIDGEYALAPSSSAENEIEPNIWIAPNATMTIAVIKETLRTALRLKKKLNVSDDRIKRWEQMLGKLPDYQVGANGALKEWTWAGIENEEAHRHASHLYPLYFGVAPEVLQSEKLREACRVAIDKRMEFRRPEDGLDMAFGFTQLGISAAHLGDLPLAYESVEYLVNSYWSVMMASFHNVGDVFNVDISGGLPAVVMTMLVQANEGSQVGEPWEINLLPCLPKEWPNGKLLGTRCRGGFELDIIWSNGALEKVIMKSLRGEPCDIQYGTLKKSFHLSKGESLVMTQSELM